MEVLRYNMDLKTHDKIFKKGEIYATSPDTQPKMKRLFNELALKTRNPEYLKAISFIDIDNFIKPVSKKDNPSNLLIIRSGGIGDIIALSSIINYFEKSKIHFLTDKKFFPVFDWFKKDVRKIDLSDPIMPTGTKLNLMTKFSNWYRFVSEGKIENGHSRNWFELFYEMIGENSPAVELLRPQLKTKRFSLKGSNITDYNDSINYATRNKSLLICNSASSMMRTIHVLDILEALDGLKGYDIYVYWDNLDFPDIDYIKKDSRNIIIIQHINLDLFLLDCYDADMVISVDSGALHFREGINKPAIGLYNSFTTESRTKHYQFTKSFDIKSDCPLQPCFTHENIYTKFCKKGNKNMFAAPCFDSKFNLTLQSQLTEIFENNL
jgi:ADP-heptose:LPS heptosyltransferase